MVAGYEYRYEYGYEYGYRNGYSILSPYHHPYTYPYLYAYPHLYSYPYPYPCPYSVSVSVLTKYELVASRSHSPSPRLQTHFWVKTNAKGKRGNPRIKYYTQHTASCSFGASCIFVKILCLFRVPRSRCPLKEIGDVVKCIWGVLCNEFLCDNG